MLKLIDSDIDDSFLQHFNFIIDDAGYLTALFNKPCRITFYVSPHRNWDQMVLPTAVENDRFKCIGPKPDLKLSIYHCKYKKDLDLEFLKNIKEKYNITNFVVACISPNFKLKMHTDFFSGSRIHFPITTNDHCFLETEDTRINCLPNNVYFLDTNIMHSACNLGRTNRLHLIGDVNAV